MAHEMERNDSAVFYQQRAWHGLGTVVDDTMDPRTALSKAGLDWDVIPSHSLNAMYIDPNTGYEHSSAITDKVANIRTDDGSVVGIVSSDYKVLQNSELAEIAYAIAGEETVVETMGSLRGGKRIYCTIKMDELFTGKNGVDVVEQYMLLVNSHDGTLAFSCLPTSVRVVCSNTLNMALSRSSGKNMIRITHNGDMSSKIHGAKQAVAQYNTIRDNFNSKVESLANKQMNSAQIQTFWTDLYARIEEPIPVPTNGGLDNEGVEKRERAMEVITHWANNFDSEYDIAGATAWNAANAVTKWIQHKDPRRGRKATSESKFNNNFFGRNAERTVDVMNTAMAI